MTFIQENMKNFFHTSLANNQQSNYIMHNIVILMRKCLWMRSNRDRYESHSNTLFWLLPCRCFGCCCCKSSFFKLWCCCGDGGSRLITFQLLMSIFFGILFFTFLYYYWETENYGNIFNVCMLLKAAPFSHISWAKLQQFVIINLYIFSFISRRRVTRPRTQNSRGDKLKSDRLRLG